MARRYVIRIELAPEAKDALCDLSDRKGMTQVAIMSRMVTWFSEQPELVQAGILGHYSGESQSDVGEAVIRQLLETVKTPAL